MTQRGWLTLALGLSLCACATGRRKPIVPEENQEEAEDMYGQQYESMQSLNQTAAEQAAARHERATSPKRQHERED
jgi:hypothetical protein